MIEIIESTGSKINCLGDKKLIRSMKLQEKREAEKRKQIL